MSSLEGRTLFVTGASRGIGLAIALRAARDGANVAVVAKTKEPHPKLPGTVYTACEEVEAAGGKALPCIADIRDDLQVEAAVKATIEAFGGIDILVNNASALHPMPTSALPMKRFDLMHQINARGTFLSTKLCHPHLCRSENAHVLTLSPPLNMEARWFAPHTGYTMSKFGMSMCVLGHAEEFRGDGIAVNALWPKTLVATAAVQNLLGGEEAMRRARKPEIMADAAYAILSKSSREFTGNFCVDEDVLRGEGVVDFDQYSFVPGADLAPDFFL